MNSIFQNITNVQHPAITARLYGMVEVENGKLARIRLQPWPKFGSRFEARFLSSWKNRFAKRDVCRLHYNQPLFHKNYLALAYLESTNCTRLATIREALQILDQIAWLKRSDAILAEVTNPKISDRLLTRLGWESHLSGRRQRHWIKRFYGEYPD